jgi:hypothetical protein
LDAQTLDVAEAGHPWDGLDDQVVLLIRVEA